MYSFGGTVHHGMLINAARRETRGPKTESEINLPFSRGFMDDITLTTATHVQSRWMLAALTDVSSWVLMKFKAVKSRSLVIKKGPTTGRFKLYVQNDEIPSIVANPIKCLGKWFDASLHERQRQEARATGRRWPQEDCPLWTTWKVQILSLPACLATKTDLAIDAV